METVTIGAVGVIAGLTSVLLFFLGFHSYRKSQSQNPRTYKRGRL